MPSKTSHQAPEHSEERERSIHAEIEVLRDELTRKSVDLALESISGLHFDGGCHLLTAIEDLRGENRAEMFISNPSNRRAFFVVDDLMGWYRRLAEQGQMLPDAGNRSWHVDVSIALHFIVVTAVTRAWLAKPEDHHQT